MSATYAAYRTARRSLNVTASRAVALIRERAGSNFPYDAPAIATEKNSDGTRWIYKPAAYGLEFVGFADELDKHSFRHRGWYCNDDNDDGEVMRAAVYSLPGKDGMSRFVAAYRQGSVSRGGWSDTAGAENACFDLSTIYQGVAGDAADDAAADAGKVADGFARIAAERECEYNRDMRDGVEAIAAIECGNEARKRARDLLAVLRATSDAITAGAMATLRDMICSELRDARAAYAKARDAFHITSPAFRDGTDGYATYMAARMGLKA